MPKSLSSALGLKYDAAPYDKWLKPVKILIGEFILSPVRLIKTREQATGDKVSILALLRELWRNRRMRTLFTGEFMKCCV